MPDKELGIYIHIPFCAGKCAYCDFYSLAGHDALMPGYQRALLQHIREAGPQLDSYLIDTVYFGGGTPSYYGADRLIALFDALKRYGHVLIEAEVTAEVNPDSITLGDLTRMKRAGFNRLSIGAQCADDGILKSLGRLHDFAQVETAVANARTAGFDNVSLDLIYGLPSQDRDGWANTLARALALKPEHLSCYGLKVEEGTPLYPFKDSPFLPDDDDQADMYLYTVETLERYGYKQYEISNFSLRGYTSRHNLKYWQGQEYFGFGAAAHSYVAGQRYSYAPDIAAYTENILHGGNVVEQSETLSEFEQASEYLMLGLRTVHGISEAEYLAIYPSDFTRIKEKLRSFIPHGWAMETGDRWHLTPTGFLVSNTLIGDVLDVQASTRTHAPWRRVEDTQQIEIDAFRNRMENSGLFHGI